MGRMACSSSARSRARRRRACPRCSHAITADTRRCASSSSPARAERSSTGCCAARSKQRSSPSRSPKRTWRRSMRLQRSWCSTRRREDDARVARRPPLGGARRVAPRASLRIHGVDFTCAPRAAKPITAACGVLRKNALQLERVERLATFAEFEALLARPGPWVGGFDFPFSLPRELVRDLGWPAAWPALLAHCATFDRLALRKALDAYRNTRQPGNRYAHRATDVPAGSSSPIKLVNPPVALIFPEGARRALASGAHVPALHDGDRTRVALEAYPGLLVRKHLGIRDSYKSDTRREQTPARRSVRKRVVAALKEGKPLG